MIPVGFIVSRPLRRAEEAAGHSRLRPHLFLRVLRERELVELAVRLGEGRVARRERALARRRPVVADVVVNRDALERLDQGVAVVVADGLLVVGRVVFCFFFLLLCCEGTTVTRVVDFGRRGADNGTRRGRRRRSARSRATGPNG